MSHCPDFLSLNELIDGGLPADQELVVRRHLDLCAVCRGAVDGLLVLKREVGRTYDAGVPSAALRRAVTAHLPKRHRTWWWVGAVAAPLLLLMATGSSCDTRDTHLHAGAVLPRALR